MTEQQERDALWEMRHVHRAAHRFCERLLQESSPPLAHAPELRETFREWIDAVIDQAAMESVKRGGASERATAPAGEDGR